MNKAKYENKSMKYMTIENKSSVTIHELKPGEQKQIEVDENEVPLDYRWRRRLRDSEIDGAIMAVKKKTNKKGGE